MTKTFLSVVTEPPLLLAREKLVNSSALHHPSLEVSFMMNAPERYKPTISTARTQTGPFTIFMPGPILTPSGLIAATAYVRVSTEDQRPSTDAQLEALLRHAETCGIEITHSYLEG